MNAQNLWMVLLVVAVGAIAYLLGQRQRSHAPDAQDPDTKPTSKAGADRTVVSKVKSKVKRPETPASPPSA
ncbi:MAG TPA: hypothetical protein VM580_17260, partial [Labilithrix sp.]|nr:hypothetical protein [Labilithrix sp.]